TWSNTPDGRVIQTGVMASANGGLTPTSPWRGSFAVPRELGLTQTAAGLRLTQQPVAEFARLRGPGHHQTNLLVSTTSDPLAGLELSGDLLELVAVFEPGTASSFGLDVRKAGDSFTRIGYEPSTETMFVDRSRAGEDGFAGGFLDVHRAPLAVDAAGLVTLRILVDRSSVEVFGNRGEAVISDLIFPAPAATGIAAYATQGQAVLRSLSVYPINSPFANATQTVAHWSMDAGGVGPVATRDTATGLGAGLLLGPQSGLAGNPSASTEDLWTFNARNQIGGVANEYRTSTQVPPLGMFQNGHTPGTASYDAGSLAGVDGALFFPTDVYGDEFGGEGAFSVELFFKVDSAGTNSPMQLLRQGETDLGYGLALNSPDAGGLGFVVRNNRGEERSVQLAPLTTGMNCVDGSWHYLLATYDPRATDDALLPGRLSLAVASADGRFASGSTPLDPRFMEAFTGGDGNLLIGRNAYSSAGAAGPPATFLGLIDELRITNGSLSPARALGRAGIPGDATQDGIVDLADLAVYATRQGQYGGTWSRADFDDDGITTQADFLLIGRHWSDPVGATGPTFAAAAASLGLAIDSPIELEVSSGVQTQRQLGYEVFPPEASIIKTGAGTLVLNTANPHSGPTTIRAGTLVLSHVDATVASGVRVEPGSTLVIPAAIRPRLPSLELAGSLIANHLVVAADNGIGAVTITGGTVAAGARLTIGAGGEVRLASADDRLELAALAIDEASGGRLDIGPGQVHVAADGIAAADLRAAIMAGRSHGEWNGTAGISSSLAAASPQARAVGYRVAADGSVVIALAAPGDVDLDGVVDVFDLLAIAAASSSSPASWQGGDFDYDGTVGLFDYVAINAAGAFGQGAYLPPPVTVATVPEPMAAAWMWSLACLSASRLAALRRRD
ncbi:MAG: Fructan beta-fructosidase, partial [Planctomycetota bacterium]